LEAAAPEQDDELKAALLKKVSFQRSSVRFGCFNDNVKLRARFLGLELPTKTKMAVAREPTRHVSYNQPPTP